VNVPTLGGSAKTTLASWTWKRRKFRGIMGEKTIISESASI
jgi:hypothetical protein